MTVPAQLVSTIAVEIARPDLGEVRRQVERNGEQGHQGRANPRAEVACVHPAPTAAGRAVGSPPHQPVFFHGVPTSGALWAPLAGRLGGWTPDLPGYGAEPALPGPELTVDEHLAWLDQTRAARDLPGWQGIDLVGHDYGGVLAAAVAARWGARSLTLCSTSLGPGWLPSKIGAWPPFDRLVYRRYGGRLWLRHAVEPNRRADWLAAFGAVTSRPDLAEQMRQTARGMSLSSMARDRRRIVASDVPVLCLWGAHDRFFAPRRGRVLARRLRGHFVEVPAARHAAVWEQPDACADALTEFWASV